MIKINHASKKIKNEIILDDISLLLEEGMVHGFEGKNGSGKTMLFRAICGLISLDSGEITINGDKIGGNALPGNIGLLLENPSFLNGLSGYENLRMIASIRQLVSEDRILELLDLVGLGQAKNKKYEAYSLGMKQRLGIANVILEDPDILIFDEPTNAIDEEGLVVLRKIIEDEKKKGKTILLSSHEHGFIRDLADRHYYMQAGKILVK